GGIFKSEPDWTRLPADTPTDIRRLLRRCLRKDLAGRLKDIGAARIQIEDALNGSESESTPGETSKRHRLVWIFAASVIVLGFAVIMTWILRQSVPAAPEMRLEVTTPATVAPLEFALSPDGRYIV